MSVTPDAWRPKGVETLDARVWDALRETERNLCVTASAGTGKTEFLAQKAAYLFETGLCPSPGRILAISFKRDAARNLAARLAERCDPKHARRLHSMTFDAFTKRLVDQFRDAIPETHRPPPDYTISSETNDQLDDFLARKGVRRINADMLRKGIARCPLPIGKQNISDFWKTTLQDYWAEQYNRHDETFLTFAMLNRLADYLLAVNPMVKRALHQTYHAVFLDEFQDTTVPQFSFLRNAFKGSSARFTAVGDDKQKIMGWAGALDTAFETFTKRFDARQITFLDNWRSHDDLVDVQHMVASRIDAAVERPVAKGTRDVSDEVCGIWLYKDQASEANDIAQWISGQVSSGKVKAHDVAILVRKRADLVERALRPSMDHHGVKFRNTSRLVGGVDIQTLMAEELTEIVLPLLRLGCTKRHPIAWASSSSALRNVYAISDDDDDAIDALRRKSGVIVSRLRQRMNDATPDADEVDAVVRWLVGEIGEERIRQSVQSYKRDADFHRVLSALVDLLSEAAESTANWQTLLDDVEGVDQVPLLTVHKSKGLEFHTVIFHGLDKGAWGSLMPDAAEELKTFFVALTRAKQRVFFTSCSGRGARVDWIEDLLGDGVRAIHR